MGSYLEHSYFNNWIGYRNKVLCGMEINKMSYEFIHIIDSIFIILRFIKISTLCSCYWLKNLDYDISIISFSADYILFYKQLSLY